MVSEPRMGQIHGLPNSRGYAIAFCETLVCIEQPNGQHYIGHRDWFVADKRITDKDIDAKMVDDEVEVRRSRKVDPMAIWTKVHDALIA